MMAVFWTDDIEREADRGLMVIVFLTSVVAPAQVFKKAGCRQDVRGASRVER
ncbi:hypothetical protein M2360_004305 [Rhizobium sp. SG_E_25_P2]|uniref:hypothetical protein n=1 Tax=Rhizobium sp. SG_E_25_P2 TaxID=2879942 RepID=UPI0024759474|nr:hypothetical protein [Rhizobium sp. SG_E_25_P2]MDH6268886.1 hypothetical protein [Rhizobium sp. SG_E_25_P2]